MVFNTLSKRSSMPGYRSGFVAGDPEIIAALKKYRPNVGVAPLEIFQRAAIAAWGDEDHVTEVRARYRAKRDVLLPALESLGLRYAGGDATFFLWVERAGRRCSGRAWLERGMVVAPGSFFGPAGEGTCGSRWSRRSRTARAPPTSSVPLRDLHANRVRAESIGTLAEEYDRLRPTIPPALVDDLVALGPERVLDVGCGTGKVARALLSRGLSVLGIEFDERMAAVARRHGVEVEVGAFEDWDARGRTFDLIVASDSWHWIDPERGWRKVGEVLAPGGTVVRMWNQLELEQPLLAALLTRWCL